MNPLLPLGIAARAFGAAASQLLKTKIWLPYVVVLLVQAVIFVIIVYFYRPFLLPLGLPLIKLLGGEAATHYPVFYNALPTLLSRADIAVTVLLTSIASGIATILFARAYGFEVSESPWRRALVRAPALILITALVVGVLFGVSALRGLIPEETMLGNARVRWGVQGAGLVLFIVLQSFFAYSTAWIVLGGRRIIPAIVDSFRVAARTLLPTLLIIGIPSVLLFPLSYAASRTDVIVGKFKPEMVSALVSAQTVIEILATFLVVGAVTRLFMWRMESTR